MNNKKQTKKALIMSVTSMVLCVAMLVGMTFAWFTDTASTAVNKIQAGNLKVELQYKNNEGNWQNAEGQTLTFKTTDNRVADKILWEPGCTYELPELRVVNKGNLALKYKIGITGIKGDEKLNEVIDWTISDASLNSYHSLAAGQTSSELTIKGHMQESAGNKYQGMSIDGIAITVYATQDAVENDSYGPNYDQDADMTPDNLDKMIVANVTQTVKADEATVLANKDNTVELTAPAGSVTAEKLTLSVQPTTKPAALNVSNDQGTKSYEVKLTDNTGATVNAENGKAFTVKLLAGTGLTNVKLYHNDELIDSTYNAETGYITFTTTSFSPFTITFAQVATAGGQEYGTIKEAFAVGGNVQLKTDVAMPMIIEDTTEQNLVPQTFITKDTKLNLNEKKIGVKVEAGQDYGKASPVLAAVMSGTLTIDGKGELNCEAGNNQVYGINVNGGKVIINSGNFYGAITAIQVQKGSLEINGGFFDMAPTCKGQVPQYAKYVVNCIDAAFKNNSATISIKGGTFVNFDPSANPEGEGTTYVAAGYKVVSETQTNGDVWYTVVKA